MPDDRMTAPPKKRRPVTSETPLVKWTLIGISGVFLALFLFLPLVTVFYEAFKDGIDVYWESISEPDTVAAISSVSLIAATVSGSEIDSQ